MKHNVISFVNDEEAKNIDTGMFDTFQNMYDAVSSDYKQTECLKKFGIYIEPEKFFTGPSLQYDKSGIAKLIDLTGYHVPMELTLKAFLELPNVFATILGYMDELQNRESTITENLVQGSHWRSKIKPLF